MTILTDVTKLTILTSLTLMFHTGLEAFFVFHFALNFPTKYSCASLRIEEVAPPVRNEDFLLNNGVYLQLWQAHAHINVTKGRLCNM